MRWPFMLKKTHDAEVNNLIADVEGEYQRAMEDGKALVRQWAVDANYNLFNSADQTLRPKVYAALQDAVNQFRPSRRSYAR